VPSFFGSAKGQSVKPFPFILAFIVAFVSFSADAKDESYVLGAGDSVTIQVFDEAELSGSFTVDEDGAIDYPLVGRVDVAGVTAKALDEELTQSLAARYLKEPQVQVEVTKFRSHPVQVLGSVKKPGLVHLSGRSSVLDVIAEAGGVTAGGVAEVRVRFADDSKADVAITLEDLMGDSGQNIQLAAGDVVHISEGMVVYVSGEVNKPGAVPYSEGLTVAQAVSKSGGAKRTARTRDAYILRGDRRIGINLKKVLKGKAADIELRPDDQIVLRESVF
jgi:polysaccharide export outer membrane protein